MSVGLDRITKNAMTERLSKLVNNAKKLLCSFAGQDTVEVCFSGGKDSCVILQLAKLSGIKFRAIYRVSSIDRPGTLRFVKSQGVEVVNPRYRFFDLVRRKGAPTRRCRFCCDYLKEYKIMDKAVQGIRRAESTRRSKLYSSEDPVICRIYGHNKKNHVNVCLPILDWTQEDVEEFILEYQIPLHPRYYNEDGTLDLTRRLGCLACPLRHDRGVPDLVEFPKFALLYVRALEDWWNSHPHVRSREKFRDVYALMCHNLLHRSYEQYQKEDREHPEQEYWKQRLCNLLHILV